MITMPNFSRHILLSSRRYSTGHAATRSMHPKSTQRTLNASSLATAGHVPNRRLRVWPTVQYRAGPPPPSLDISPSRKSP